MKFSYKWNGRWVSEEGAQRKVGKESLERMKQDTLNQRSRASWLEEGERYSVNWGFQTEGGGFSEDTLTITVR